jgi:plasmid maintenance system antidote protein VapI
VAQTKGEYIGPRWDAVKWEIIDRLIEAHPGWTPTNIGPKLGFSASYWSDLRNGKEPVTLQVAFCIAAFFDLQYSDFLYMPNEVLQGSVREMYQTKRPRKRTHPSWSTDASDEGLRTRYRMLATRLRRSGAQLITWAEFRQRWVRKITAKYHNVQKSS